MRGEQVRPHSGNVLEAAVGRMLADKAENERARRRTSVAMGDILTIGVVGLVPG